MRYSKFTAAAPVAVAFLLSFAAAHANDERVLYRFQGGSDGQWPYGGVVRDAAGNLYGATYVGGTCGCGTIYKLAPDGTETVLHSLNGAADGSYPLGDLILDTPTGDLYGTASLGGNLGCANGGGQGCGTIFKVAPDGTFTTLYAFSGDNDGGWPSARLIRDEQNNFYGTAYSWGAGGGGTVFRFSPDGKLTVLHSFVAQDGMCPRSRLKRDKAGNLYGTAESNCTDSLGSVFKLASDGTFSKLHGFTGGADGASPYGGLAKDFLGNLYGTTLYGGDPNCNCGVVFKINPNGAETVLHTFLGGNNGKNPYATLLRSKNGSFYGTTQWGGHYYGKIFKITPGGKFGSVYGFYGGDDGANPLADLIEDENGNLYGTTQNGGGAKNYGTVFTVKE